MSLVGAAPGRGILTISNGRHVFDFLDLGPKHLPLSDYERKITQPNGIVEEGLMEHLFSVHAPAEQFCVEFGAGDGESFSLARNLIERHGFAALVIEGDDAMADALVNRYRLNPRVVARRAFVSRENIISLFREAKVPARIALLSIDVDGNDYYLWETIAREYRADYVCIEYNGGFAPGEEFVIAYDPSFRWSGDDYFGASFSSLVRLGETLGYRLIHCSSGGDNLIFASADIARKFPSSRMAPDALYQLPQYGRFGRARNGKGHPASERTATRAERGWYGARYYLMSLPRKLLSATRDLKG
jgi:hypothetical protein